MSQYIGNEPASTYAGSIVAQQLSGNNSTTTFNLNSTPVSVANTSVYINGIYQNKSTYAIIGTSLVFDQAPPTGTNNIEVVVSSTLPFGVGAASSITFAPTGNIASTNVQSAISEVVTDLALSSGAAGVGFLQAGSGAVAITTQDRLRQTVSIYDFLSASFVTATTDCSTAMLAADTYAAANGFTVEYSHGTFLVSNSITLTAPVFFEKGASIAPSTGITVAFTNYVDAGTYQIFSGNGTVTVVNEAKDSHSDWWGQPVSTLSSFPYAPAPIELLRGLDHEKFAITLAKAQQFTDYPNFKLNPKIKTAFASGTVRVTIVGDSISAGADNWRSNAYTTLLRAKMKQTFPWINFVFVNMCIPGMTSGNLVSDSYVGVDRSAYVISTNFWFPVNNGGLNNNDTLAGTNRALLNEDYWPAGSVNGKTWKKHVSDTNPDMIVYAFGMNDGTDLDAFNTNYAAFQTYMGTEYPGNAPWFALVSCFLPTKNPPAGQPHATWQIPAQAISDQVRYFAKRDNYGLIDANGVFDVLRDGSRHDHTPFIHEPNWRYGADTTKWTFGSGFVFNSAQARGEGTGMAVRNIAARDVDFSATFFVTAFDGVYYVARMSYRNQNLVPGGLTGYTVDVVQQSNSQNASITVYYKGTVIKSATYNQGAMPVVGQSFAVKIKSIGDRMEVWLNSALVVDFDTVNTCYAGAVQVGVAQGVGYVKYLGLSYAESYAETPSHVDKLWLYGKPVYSGNTFQMYSDFEVNDDSIGGSVVNHPSRWGHNTYYGFGVMRFIEELRQRVNDRIVIQKRAVTPFTVSAAINTPQIVNTIQSIVVTPRVATHFSVQVNVVYSVVGQTTYPQIGLFVDGTWSYSSYVPIAADMGMASVSFSVPISAGTHTIALGAVRSGVAETYTIGHSGGEYSINLIESDV